MTPKFEILGQTFAHFNGFEGSFLTILGVKKVVFWTFSKIFWSCLRSVRALFSTLKGLLLVVFPAPKVDKWPQKLNFSVKNLLILTLWGVIFDHFGFKKSFFGYFRFFENFKVKCLYSLLPMTETDALLWGPAEALHQEKSVGFWLISKFYPPLRKPISGRFISSIDRWMDSVFTSEHF